MADPGAPPPATPPWRAGVDADRRRRPRRIANEREALRQLTATVAAAAVVLNGALFVETATTNMSAGDLNNAILSVIATLLPGSVRPPSAGPVATPSPAVVVTGAS